MLKHILFQQIWFDLIWLIWLWGIWLDFYKNLCICLTLIFISNLHRRDIISHDNMLCVSGYGMEETIEHLFLSVVLFGLICTIG